MLGISWAATILFSINLLSFDINNLRANLIRIAKNLANMLDHNLLTMQVVWL